MACASFFGDVEVAVDCRAKLGEAPTWCSREQALYWIDIEEPSLHRFDPRTSCDEKWEAPCEIGAIALCESGEIILASRMGLLRHSFERGDCQWLAQPPFNPFTHRFNDGACDARGRFWIGTMRNPLQGASGQGSCKTSIYVFSHEKGLREADGSAAIGNGIVWSPDSRIMYYTDSAAGEVHCYDFDLDAGRLSAPRLFRRFEPAEGRPDGAAVDNDGCYWCALYGGGRVVCLDRDAKLVREIRLPVSQPTMCAFGDEDGGTLYVTSAARGLSPREEPFAGAIFRCRTGATGRAARHFWGDSAS